MNRKIVSLGEKIHDAMLDFHKASIKSWWPWDSTLCGGCAVASFFLVKELRRQHGIRATFVGTPHHAFVEYKGYIYDITATQFSQCKEKCLVIHKSNVRDVSDWMQRDAYLSKGSYPIARVNRTWNKGQKPKQYELTWINKNKARIRYIG